MQQNFARAWRSKTFEEVIGQELSIRLLQNSLAQNRIFPVYLFSGLRGSGKTSSGRIFAAAINCSALPLLQQNHKHLVPCLQCESCLNMKAGNHPDFIEIDAASHTGVDNVRHIIESASFLPVMGVKKVYLIDEAHMLSKAAFNAFLKILEEPPATAVFLLATTEAHKILETVQSRCFHLFFDAVPEQQLVKHLIKICMAERIVCEEAGCELIARQSEGSVRDALTMAERVALAEGEITYDTVRRTLGLLQESTLIGLFQVIARGSVQEALGYMHSSKLKEASPTLMWENTVAVLRALLWEHAATGSERMAGFPNVADLRTRYSLALVLEFFDLFYRAESHFLKTTSKHALLESLLCKMTQRFEPAVPDNRPPVPSYMHAHPEKLTPKLQAPDRKPAQPLPTVDVSPMIATPLPSHTPSTDRWQLFVQELDGVKNPVALSIFRQGTLVAVEQDVIKVRFAKKFEFYYEWIFANTDAWKPALEKVFGEGAAFEPEFITQQVSTGVKDTSLDTSAPIIATKLDTFVENRVVAEKKSPEIESEFFSGKVVQKDSMVGGRRESIPLQSRVVHKPQEKIDVSDGTTWQTTHMIMQIFPGTVTMHKD